MSELAAALAGLAVGMMLGILAENIFGLHRNNNITRTKQLLAAIKLLRVHYTDEYIFSTVVKGADDEIQPQQIEAHKDAITRLVDVLDARKP